MTRYHLTLSGGSRNTLTPEIIEADHYCHGDNGWISFNDAENVPLFQVNGAHVQSIERLGISSVEQAAKNYRAAIIDCDIALRECKKHRFSDVPEALENRRLATLAAMREAETALINAARGEGEQ